MELELFDLENICKNDNIKIICADGRHHISCDNICVKLKMKYGVSREKENFMKYDQYHTDISVDKSKFIHVSYKTESLRGHRRIYSEFMQNTNYHNHILHYYCYSHLIDTVTTFICGEKTKSNIEIIFRKYIAENTLSLEQLFEIFQKYNIIAIADKGKKIMYYEEVYLHSFIYSYYDNSDDLKYVSDLINKIVNKKNIYHVANGTFHNYLLSRIDIFRTYYYALVNYMPIEICNIILNFLTVLCKEKDDRKNIVRTCLKDYDNDTFVYWSAYLVMMG